MATIHLYDHSLSGAIEFVTDDSPEEVHAYLESVVGIWADLPGTWGEWFVIVQPDGYAATRTIRLAIGEHAEVVEG